MSAVKLLTEEFGSLIEEMIVGNVRYIPKDYTEQEELIAKVLKSKGLRFDQQVRFSRADKKNPLVVDFYVPEINCVIEADNFMHFRKADEKRDKELLELGVENIIHIKSITEETIEEELDKALKDNGY